MLSLSEIYEVLPLVEVSTCYSGNGKCTEDQSYKKYHSARQIIGSEDMSRGKYHLEVKGNNALLLMLCLKCSSALVVQD